MTIIDAYYFVFEIIEELKKDGIKISVEPTPNNELTDYSNKKQDRLPPKFWKQVKFTISNDKQAKKIQETANYLGVCGISFDTGGSEYVREWEIDFSFRYDKNNDNWDWKKRREDVEDIIKRVNKNK